MKITAKLRRKITAASSVQERFWEVICLKMMETGIPQIISFNRTPQTFKCKHRTPQCLRSPQHRKLGFFFTATPHKKNTQHRNTANPQCPPPLGMRGANTRSHVRDRRTLKKCRPPNVSSQCE